MRSPRWHAHQIGRQFAGPKVGGSMRNLNLIVGGVDERSPTKSCLIAALSDAEVSSYLHRSTSSARQTRRE